MTSENRTDINNWY